MKALDHLKESLQRFSLLEDEVWQDFSCHWEAMVFSKGEHVTEMGSIERYFYFVYSGVLRGYALNDGMDISFGFTYDGEFSGVYDSFLDQKPADWGLEALQKTETLRISFKSMMKMYDDHKSIERWGRVFNAKMLVGMGRRQLEVRNFSAEERFDRLYRDSPHIFQLVPQKHLASYLGMTPETFSRLRRQRMDEKRN
ncbi:Crp/Fnr family transcriptional regulator [Reichenbachiella versicolor]|uniref:Crp/Fnr family transcriptional regulator n=1 Tax=Reichenbachiella versicolor TaxID=1821036 RepID=UPI001FE2C2AD|nr:Crp/Fnr family transcriptional regulator [Reichenbachiella versicolor]